LRAVFLGTPAFAVPTLRELMRRHEVALVVTQPDRPAGRGMAIRTSPVAEAAGANADVLKPGRAKDPEVEAAVRAVSPDVLVVAAYGQILPPGLLDAAPAGALNVHASLLPRWRGASPVAAAILAGDDETGVSIMRLEEGLDTGPVLLRRAIPIATDDTTGTLTERLAELGAEALMSGLDLVERGAAVFEPQPDEGATYAERVKKSDGELTWDRPAQEIGRSLRAYDPWPGVRVPIGGERLRLVAGQPLPRWTAEDRDAEAGTVLEIGPEGILVMAGDGPFRVTTVQPAGRRVMAAADWARGRRKLRLGKQ
jgi:methionyl-tRNA formyltransferase